MGDDLSRLGEFGVIDLIRQQVKTQRPWVDTGIGDDCAVLKLPDNQRLLVTTDMLLDRVHFLKDRISPWQLGYKSMAVNLSDIAAMGGEPMAAFLALGLTPEADEAYVGALRDGLLCCAKKYDVDLLGGDTVAAKTDLTLCLTVLGLAQADQVIRRSGAKPDDRIVLGGPVGDSAAGLHLLLEPTSTIDDSVRQKLQKAHLEPQPQVALGRLLAANHLASAMIDVSDGVLQDLSHLCGKSGVGATLDAAVLPISQEAQILAQRTGRHALDWALSGGEDYVLMFCVAPDRLNRARDLANSHLGMNLYEIGTITLDKKLMLRQNGSYREVSPRGYDAFRSK